jgi:F-type H+-transporting ATPase subunit a
MDYVAEIGAHVQDADSFDLPFGVHVHLPHWHFGPWEVFGQHVEFEWQLTKFMVLEVVAAALMIVIFVPLAWRIRRGGRPRGLVWNFFELILLFIRDQIARPTIGRREADRFLPFIWNIFFFVLFCNLLGLVPWGGSPTGALAVTGTLALITFLMVLGSGMAKSGIVGYWLGMAPSMEIPLVLALVLKPMLIMLEVVGLCVKHCVLAVRLLANMFAGHLVVFVIISFIKAATDSSFFILWAGVTAGSVLGAVAVSMLELIVAFLQAYIFAFLSAVFIGMAVHQH